MEFSLYSVINILITIYLVIDSKKHGKNPVLWGILGFIFGIITLSIYWIRTDKKLLGWIILILAIIFHLLLILFIFAVLFMSFT
ncbi:hypothetical protein A499_17705 [Niallia nealsonii AAU1]|nr:hypothetical protein A499_17705 [Niallia nealsonii AAU1]